ncbi:MAG TPA: branched-chain amino acid ABC transporter permease [Hyphomicrobiales bacterium]|nr:branched-chain amino acid ABC transporter permease [Hyphomicrobiales bacterium]
MADARTEAAETAPDPAAIAVGVAERPAIDAPDTALWKTEIGVLPHTPAAILRWAVFAIVLLLLPQVLGPYWLSQINYVLIYTLAGMGLQILLGYTGQISIAHAAFMGIGAYACAYFERLGMDFPLAFLAAAFLTGAVGAAIAGPARRVSGLSLLVASMAFNFIVQQAIERWTPVTGGDNGLSLLDLDLFGLPIKGIGAHYYLYLGVVAVSLWVAFNILRSPLGRAMNAVRDSEVAARSMGVDIARIKTIAFGLSAFFGAFAGALYAHQITFISPDQFGLQLSLDLIVMLVVGGAGSLAGIVLGAIFLVVVPELLDYVLALFSSTGEPPGARPILEGGLLIIVMLFEPWGLYGLWLRLKRRLFTRRRAGAPAAGGGHAA